MMQHYYTTTDISMFLSTVVVVFGYDMLYYQLAAWLTFPMFLGRQIVNCAQLAYACRCIAAIDARQRLIHSAISEPADIEDD